MKRAFFIVLLSLISAVSGGAQVRYRPTDAGVWRPWKFYAISSARVSRGATPAEVQAFQSRILELGEILRHNQLVTQPVGFAALLSGSLSTYDPPRPGEPSGKQVPLAGTLDFGAIPLVEFMRNGRLTNEDMQGGETELLEFVLNRIDQNMFGESSPSEWGQQEAVGFTEPQRSGTMAGGLVRYNDVLVLVPEKYKERPLWLPLTLEEALTPVVAQQRMELEHRRQGYANQQREYDEWMSPRAHAERRSGWATSTQRMNDEEKRKFMELMLKSEKDTEQVKREMLAPGGSLDKGVHDAERQLKEAESALASVANKNAPACYDRNASSLSAKFRMRTAAPASCKPLVKTNWAYFDMSRPRSSPQVLVVNMFARCLTPESLKQANPLRGGCFINRQLINSLDWGAVRTWMDR